MSEGVKILGNYYILSDDFNVAGNSCSEQENMFAKIKLVLGTEDAAR